MNLSTNRFLSHSELNAKETGWRFIQPASYTGKYKFVKRNLYKIWNRASECVC